MTVYRIVDWAENFETAENRKLTRLTWLALPTKQEGDGYTELMGAHENGCAHFGAWTAVLQLAAKCDPRGVLVRQLGGRLVAHDIASISRITRVPPAVLTEALPRLLEIGWMETVPLVGFTNPPENQGRQDGKPSRQDGEPVATGEGRTGEDSTGQHRGGEGTPPPPASPVSSGPPREGAPSPTATKRRTDLLVILKANHAKLELASGPLFEEWVRDTDGYHLGWIEHLFKTVRPRIGLPSGIRKALKEHAAEYETWKRNRGAS